mmetsp:Transcript_25966/g.26395  ORF Transcript_25966/g.26395 Transcript_25966/m.26395 type:complete len:135 (-) Transcript_25966:59-463(-)
MRMKKQDGKISKFPFLYTDIHIFWMLNNELMEDTINKHAFETCRLWTNNIPEFCVKIWYKPPNPNPNFSVSFFEHPILFPLKLNSRSGPVESPKLTQTNNNPLQLNLLSCNIFPPIFNTKFKTKKLNEQINNKT